MHYMMLSFDSNVKIRIGEELHMLPRGLELSYTVDYYDDVGSKFNAVDSKSKIFGTRADLATFKVGHDNAISAFFHQNGMLVAKVFNEKQPNALFDYAHMPIGNILFPSSVSIFFTSLI